MDREIKKHQNANPWLDHDTLKNYKSFKEKKNILLDIISNRVDSVLTLSEQPAAHDTAKEDEAEESDTDKENSRSNNDASKKHSQPKGTTKKEILAAKQKKQMALNHAALELKKTANDVGERLPKGSYNKIIEETKPTLLTIFSSSLQCASH